MHSFALTPPVRRASSTQPFGFDLLRHSSGPTAAPIVTNFRWEGVAALARHPHRPRGAAGSRPRSSSSPFFVFHHINAYERGDRVVIDVCAHRDSGDRRRALPQAPAQGRCRDARGRAAAADDRSGRRPVEDARPGRRRLRAAADRLRPGQPAPLPLRLRRRRQAHPRRSGFIDRVAKLESRERRRRLARARRYPGEPVFVRRPRRAARGRRRAAVGGPGRRRRTSFLLVLDARDARAARAAVPHHIPFGFHGLHRAA